MQFQYFLYVQENHILNLVLNYWSFFKLPEQFPNQYATVSNRQLFEISYVLILAYIIKRTCTQ